MVDVWRPASGEERARRAYEGQARRERDEKQAKLSHGPLCEVVEGWTDFYETAPVLVCEIEFLDWEAEMRLGERDRLTVRKMIVSAFRAARASGDSASRATDTAGSAEEKRAAKVADVLAARRASIQEYVLELAQVRARKRYARGFYWGAFASILVLLLVGLVMKEVVVELRRPLEGGTQLNPKEFFALRDSLACIGGGSLGAAMSVLLRIGSGHPVPYRTTSGATAFYRIILGWIFAAGILCLVKGHIVALFPDPTESLLESRDPFSDPAVAGSFFFWVGVGLLAGFNERWVKRLFSQPVSEKEKSK